MLDIVGDCSWFKNVYNRSGGSDREPVPLFFFRGRGEVYRRAVIGVLSECDRGGFLSYISRVLKMDSRIIRHLDITRNISALFYLIKQMPIKYTYISIKNNWGTYQKIWCTLGPLPRIVYRNGPRPCHQLIPTSNNWMYCH